MPLGRCAGTPKLCAPMSRLAHLLESPISDVWLNSKYIDALKDFEVIMPSETEIYTVSGDMFPGPINMPKKVKARGRPKVKSFKKGDRQFKTKMLEMTGDGSMDKHRQCSCCRGVGHVTTRCPVKGQFPRMQK